MIAKYHIDSIVKATGLVVDGMLALIGKHAQHDQSTHGRGRGGVGVKRTATNAGADLAKGFDTIYTDSAKKKAEFVDDLIDMHRALSGSDRAIDRNAGKFLAGVADGIEGERGGGQAMTAKGAASSFGRGFDSIYTDSKSKKAAFSEDLREMAMGLQTANPNPAIGTMNTISYLSELSDYMDPY